MKRFNLKILLLFSFSAIVYSCEIYDQDEFEEEYFVEGYLIAGEPIGEFRLSTTAEFKEEYSFDNYAVRGGEMRVFELDENDNRVDTIPLNDSNLNGIYTTRSNYEVRPLKNYELEVVSPNEDTIRAFTTVPDTFRVDRTIRDEVTYQSNQQVEVDLTQSTYPGRQNIYIFSTEALSPEEYPMTPLYETDDQEDREITHQIRSNIITQGNYETNEDGTVTLAYPWLAVAWFGPNRVTAYAIDDNTYDFYRSQDVQLGGNTQAPGQIENVIYNIEGGIGLFGAMAGASFEFYVNQP